MSNYIIKLVNTVLDNTKTHRNIKCVDGLKGEDVKKETQTANAFMRRVRSSKTSGVSGSLSGCSASSP